MADAAITENSVLNPSVRFVDQCITNYILLDCSAICKWKCDEP